ncbi:hypothetical protein FQN60_004452 [Etheostoma spectabile]|uniref:RGS domain-containing protein n=1 Tax=Etheostoma spectabile TaxID=54343 RepID=A0A5J5CTI6_9PERO|nr:hypothetical protein FQN60_004452 [Etheostoma spectabile]
MQDPKSGIKGSDQKLNVTTIPHVIAAIYLAKRNIRKKGMLEPYEQAHYNHLHEWLNHKWDFIVMQASEQYKHPDNDENKTVTCKNSIVKITIDMCRRRNVFYQQAIMRSKVKSSVSLGALAKYVTTYKNHDPFLAPCLPSNPWQTDDDTYWTLNMRLVDVPTKMRVERWSFSLFELLSDLRGRDDFKVFLKKEFSGRTFLAPGAPRWINIDGRTMGLTVKGLDHPHRYVLEAAQTHVFLLMKKDTFFRYLKSPVYKDIQKKALNPEPHNFSPAQLEKNAQNRGLGIHPIILWQQEEEQKAKAAVASAPVDVKAMMSKIDRNKRVTLSGKQMDEMKRRHTVVLGIGNNSGSQSAVTHQLVGRVRAPGGRLGFTHTGHAERQQPEPDEDATARVGISTEVLWDMRLRLVFSGSVNTSRSNGSMWPSSQSQTSWNLEDARNDDVNTLHVKEEVQHPKY